MELLAAIDTFFFEPVAQQLYALHPNLPLVPDRTTSLIGSWHLSPKQHVLEFIIYNAVFMFALWRSWKAFPNWTVEAQRATIPAAKRSKTAKAVEAVASVIVIVSIISMVIYKIKRESIIFLLQPCHVFNFLLVALCFWPEKNTLRHAFFHVHLHCCWGAILALAFPDLRDYGMLFEVHFFFIQHIFLIVLPLVWLITGKFSLVSMRGNGFVVTLFGFFMHAVYHSLVLALVGLYTGKNVNYLMSPPTGILEHFGIFYRPVMYAFCFVLTVVMRFLFIGGFAKLFNVKAFELGEPKHKKPQASVSLPTGLVETRPKSETMAKQKAA